MLLLGLFALATVFAAGACLGSDDEPTSYVEMLYWVPNEPEYRCQIWVMGYDAVRALPAPDGLAADTPPLGRIAATAWQYSNFRLVAPLGSNAALPCRRL